MSALKSARFAACVAVLMLTGTSSASGDADVRAAAESFEKLAETAFTASQATLDKTFGPRAVFHKGCDRGQDNVAPCFGLQFFGHVAIDGLTEVMTVTLKDVEDRALWSVDLVPQMSA